MIAAALIVVSVVGATALLLRGSKSPTYGFSIGNSPSPGADRAINANSPVAVPGVGRPLRIERPVKFVARLPSEEEAETMRKALADDRRKRRLDAEPHWERVFESDADKLRRLERELEELKRTLR